MTVLHLITDLKRGGEAVILLSLVPWLEQRGVRCHVCCISDDTDGGTTSVIPDLEQAGVHVIRLGIRTRWQFWRLAKLPFILARVRPDILHTYLFHANVAGRLAAMCFPRMRVISSMVAIDIWKTPLQVWLDRVTSPLCDTMLVNAQRIVKTLLTRERIAADKITVIYNGVDTTRLGSTPGDVARVREQLGIASDDYVIGVVGRMHPQKEPLKVVAAFHRFLQKVPQARLIMIGEGPLREAVDVRIAALGIGARVHVAGNVSAGIASYYQSMNAVVIASIYEGIPAVIFEAMFLRIPVISTPWEGLEEVLGPEAALITSDHSEDSLTAALETAHRDAAGGRVRAERAFEIVTTRFNNEASFENRLHLYEQVLLRSSKLKLIEGN